MPKQGTIIHDPATGFSEKKTLLSSIFNRPVVFGLMIFTLLVILFTLLILQRYQLARESREKQAFEVALQAKDRIQIALTHSFAAAKVLALLVDKNGAVNNFDSVAAQILEAGTDMDAVQLVPDGVIKYIYPVKGNEKAIGFDILKDSFRNKEALKAIEEKAMYFGGPFELRQGGMGVVGRLPVFRQNKFWGFSAAVIKMSTLYRVAGIDSSGKDGYYYQLSKINPDTKKEEFFLPQYKAFAKHQAVSVEVPNGAWKLSVYSSFDEQVFTDIGLLALLALLLSVLGAYMGYRFAVKPGKLKELVLNRTSELKTSESNYRAVIERVSDAFMALDKNWCYTYLNEKAGELLGRDPQSLIGKNIWQEFPGGVEQPFYLAYQRAMQTQEYQYLEEYYPAFDKWLENHIYPSRDGLTVFLKDVTDIKNITQALKDKEEKYRNLIEQASDGIVITDMEGMILEVNNSIQEMLGYTEEELVGYSITDFLPEEDLVTNPLRIYELLKGKALLYERRLKKKDGSYLDVEMNSKMATTHTLIGFMRDITERKRIQNKLIYQANLLESVSDAVTSLDIERQIVSWNKACENLYGLTAAEVMGKRPLELVTFEYPNSNNEEVFKEVFEQGNWKGEFNFIHPQTKEKIYLLSNINLLKDNNGNNTGFIITSKNITERIKAEEEIKRSNERFELIAQATNDAIWDHDIVKNETWGNKNLYNMYGLEYGKEKIDFEMFLNHIHPNEQEGILQRMQRAILNKEVSLAETFHFKDAKGDFRIFYDRAYIKYDDEGNPLKILGAMQDISERKKAEEILEESERFLKETQQIAKLGTYTLDIATGKWESSAILNEIFGIEAGYEKNVESWEHMIHPSWRETMSTYFREEVIGKKKRFDKEYLVIRQHDKAERWVHGIGSLKFNKNGQPVQMVGTIQDVTENKLVEVELSQSEQKYRLLFYNNPMPMWMTNIPALDFIDVNESAIKQYGYSREEFLSMNLRDLRPAADVPSFLEELERLQPEKINTRSWRHKKKDGTIIYVETYSHQIVYEGEKVWLGLTNDVTDKHLAEEQLQKSYEDIRQLATNLQNIREEERTNIAREIHDELGQQLTGLKMDIYWLSRKINNADQEITNKLQQSIELINATVTSVRKIATNLRPSILDDLGLIAALEWQGEEFEKRSGTKVEFINEAGEISLHPDAVTGIFRIYQELLTNVARHANATAVKTALKRKDDMLFFSLRDNGNGFDPEIISKKKTLGLLGIKERTLLLGGTYEFKSKPNEGSETIISIPIIQ